MRQNYNLIPAAIFVAVLLIAQNSSAQNVGINSTGSAPDASAGLDVSFTNKGLLVPRVALTATNSASPVTSPATSLLVYNTATAGAAPNDVVPGYYYWNGSAWTLLSTGTAASNWSVTGNSTSNTNFLGTTNNQSLRFRTNNLPRLHVDSLGSVAVGYNPSFSTTAREKFLVDAGGSSLSPLSASAGFNVISGKGYINNYLQLNIQNRYAGTAASSDVVATADNGDETTNYVDMGINSSANTANYFGSANDAYLFNIGQNFLIGTGTASKSLVFLTGGGTQSTNERMRISGTGNVGIGNTNPTYKLQVNAASDPLYLTGVQAGSNTDSLLTITNGVVKKLASTALATPSTNAWSLTGNASASTNFLGPTNAQSLRIRTNNLQRFQVDSLGSVGVGSGAIAFTASPNREKFLVDAGTTTSYNVISGKGTINNYLQLNIQNKSSGTAASSDVVASNNTATETVNFVDLGINSSGNTSTGVLGGASTGYLYSTGNDFAIGNATANKNLIFFTNGTTSDDEKMRITSAGSVGIGSSDFDSTYPEKLLVDGGDAGSNPMNLFLATGTSNNYIQSGVQNLSHGNNASSDFVVTADGSRNGTVPNGTDNFYLDFGINSSGYSTNNSNILNQTNTPYLYASAPQDFFIGQGYPGKDIVFFTNYGNLNGNNSADGTELMRLKGGTGSSTQQVTIGTPTPNGSNKLTVAGSISATAFNVSSDRRLKTNIKPLTYGLKTLQALNPVSYNWTDPKQSAQLQLGLIAQDTKKVIPEAVSGDENKGMLSINYTELVPVLINAIKEQQAQIDELKKSLQKIQGSASAGTSTASGNK